jgi:hypothetical protein
MGIAAAALYSLLLMAGRAVWRLGSHLAHPEREAWRADGGALHRASRRAAAFEKPAPER